MAVVVVVVVNTAGDEEPVGRLWVQVGRLVQNGVQLVMLAQVTAVALEGTLTVGKDLAEVGAAISAVVVGLVVIVWLIPAALEGAVPLLAIPRQMLLGALRVTQAIPTPQAVMVEMIAPRLDKTGMSSFPISRMTRLRPSLRLQSIGVFRLGFNLVISSFYFKVGLACLT
jgi:hypothetical protein